MIKRLTCFRHQDILTRTRSRMTTAIRFSRQNDSSLCVHITRLVIVLVLEPKAMLKLKPIFVPTLKVIRYSMNTYQICDSPLKRRARRSFAPLKKLVSLSSDVFERYTSTGSVACVQTSPLPQRKNGRRLREGERLYTGYRKWSFFICGQCFCPNFWTNRLYNSKDTFYLVTSRCFKRKGPNFRLTYLAQKRLC